MAEKAESDSDGERKREKFGKFLQKNITKGEMAIKHAAGLGHVPNVVPVTKPVLDGARRPIEVGWHPVGGFAGKWFAEDTGLGKMITDKINKYPDPTQHWAVLVGNFAHQLWMDESFDVIYTNQVVKREEWQTFQVGETRFNDDAIRRAGETVIKTIRSKQPAYNLITNNCQTYALQLLDAVKADGFKQFGTTLDVYERLTGSGKVVDLFAKPLGEVQPEEPEGGQGSVSLAQQVMNENTTQLDTQEEKNKHDKKKEDNKKDKEDRKRGKDDKEHKGGLFSRFTRK